MPDQDRTGASARSARAGAARGRSRPGWPLQADFALVAALVVATGAAAALYVHVQADSDGRQAAQLAATFAAGRASAQLDDGVRYLQAALRPVARSPSIDQTFARPAACTVGYAPVGAFATGHIDILRLDGSVVCSSRPPPATGPLSGYAGQSWLGTTTSTVVAPVLDPATGEQVAIVIEPVPGLGMLAAFLNLQPVGTKLASEFGGGPDRLDFLVTDRSGTAVIASSTNPARWTGTRLAGSPWGNSATERADLAGTPRLYGEPAAEGDGWKVYSGADKAAALATSDRLQNQQLVIIGAGILVVLLALSLVYRRVARPITRLGAALRASSTQDTLTPVAAGGPREVAALAQAFNALIAAVSLQLSQRENAEQNYRLLFENSPLPMWVHHSKDLRILEVNQAAVQRYGYSREEFEQMTMKDLVMPDDWGALEHGDPATEPALRVGPFFHRQKDGSGFEVRVTAHTVDFGHRPARFIVVEDVTEQEKLERQLRQSQRLESLGQLAAGVAHDFNNLLAVILNVTEFARDQIDAAVEIDGPDRWRAVQRDLERLEEAATSATRLTRRLLAFGQRDIAQPTAMDVNERVQDLAELLRRTLGERVALTIELAKGLPPVLIDHGQFEQIILNLAVNARDAMPEGGTLTISTADVQVDDDVDLQGQPSIASGRYVQLQVTDSGTGMDPETLDHAFEPFYTTKAPGVGTGLGLAGVYGIVAQSAGRVSIQSEPGHGTSVTVLLPATELSLTAALIQAPASPLGATETILLVEDYADLREVMAETVQRAGYQVLTASDGPAALKIAEQHSGEIDLLLTDVVLPKMLGTALADQLRARHPGLRVLFMSGYAHPLLGAEGTLEPQVNLIQKPFMESALLQKLRDVLEAAPTTERPVPA